MNAATTAKTTPLTVFNSGRQYGPEGQIVGYTAKAVGERHPDFPDIVTWEVEFFDLTRQVSGMVVVLTTDANTAPDPQAVMDAYDIGYSTLPWARHDELGALVQHQHRHQLQCERREEDLEYLIKAAKALGSSMTCKAQAEAEAEAGHASPERLAALQDNQRFWEVSVTFWERSVKDRKEALLAIINNQEA